MLDILAVAQALAVALGWPEAECDCGSQDCPECWPVDWLDGDEGEGDDFGPEAE